MSIEKKVIINNHPFYEDPRFQTEKDILVALTQICDLDNSVGVIDYYPDAPVIEIGIINENADKVNKIPHFQKNSQVTLNLLFKGEKKSFEQNILDLPKDISFEALQKIVAPITINFENVMNFLVDYYDGDFKESCIASYENFFNKKFVPSTTKSTI